MPPEYTIQQHDELANSQSARVSPGYIVPCSQTPETDMVQTDSSSLSQSARIFPSYTGATASTPNTKELEIEDHNNTSEIILNHNNNELPPSAITTKPLKETKTTRKATGNSQKQKTADSMQRNYIIELERKVNDRDKTIQLMETRLAQLEQRAQVTPPQIHSNNLDSNQNHSCNSNFNQNNCQIQPIMNNIKMLEHQLTQHMCTNGHAATTKYVCTANVTHSKQLELSFCTCIHRTTRPLSCSIFSSTEPTGMHRPTQSTYNSSI